MPAADRQAVRRRRAPGRSRTRRPRGRRGKADQIQADAAGQRVAIGFRRRFQAEAARLELRLHKLVDWVTGMRALHRCLRRRRLLGRNKRPMRFVFGAGRHPVAQNSPLAVARAACWLRGAASSRRHRARRCGGPARSHRAFPARSAFCRTRLGPSPMLARSSRSLASRAASSGPWHLKQCWLRMGRTSREKSGAATADVVTADERMARTDQRRRRGKRHPAITVSNASTTIYSTSFRGGRERGGHYVARRRWSQERLLRCESKRGSVPDL